MVLYQILSRNYQNRDNLALITWYLGAKPIFINEYHAILSVNGGVTHTNLNIYQFDHRISYSTTQFGDYIFMNNSV